MPSHMEILAALDAKFEAEGLIRRLQELVEDEVERQCAPFLPSKYWSTKVEVQGRDFAVYYVEDTGSYFHDHYQFSVTISSCYEKALIRDHVSASLDRVQREKAEAETKSEEDEERRLLSDLLSKHGHPDTWETPSCD